MIPLNRFFRVFELFSGEHVFIEMLLEHFVGKVNTELFETISMMSSLGIFKDFKTKDIQDSN